MEHIINELIYNGTIKQRNYRKITISWSFSYNFFAKFHDKKKMGATLCLCYIKICIIVRCVIMGQHCILEI